ncbi:aldehyde dehydrogenase family protein [Pseudonocardia endophytica]|uniref:Succinate-semialdehyde dehydrogenase/glutarate-semialdehyde dehydrogenase n=1 Tax=Pseudonocardia endophytica TaxID=401976 RepID=A0A4R1HSM6_PSEEN|nr:aldehyde dehydrogenase family protein [Pseudonocardia endophytica]TCK25647.1 succinate-semialdehyde dehydrogenase/glutarate-semialdehyde dehydrogenase [Pseudonocardia endophytica]
MPGPAVLDVVRSPRTLRIGSLDRDTESGFAVLDPATDAELAIVPDAGAAHAGLAADAAAAALVEWGASAPRRRSEILVEAFRLMKERELELAALISAESGKAPDDARAEVAYAAEFFRWFGEEAVRSEGRYVTAPDGRSTTVVTSQPVGVAYLVTPWNFPAAMITRKVAPALAAGCTMVVKPAAETPLTALALADLLGEAGLPPGVLTVLPTTRPGEVTDVLLAHDAVRKLSFTGSTAVGRHLLRAAAGRVVNCSMELGGNAPFVVCADADLDAAVAGAMVAKLRNAGQACTAANRFFVHSAVLDEFVERLTVPFTGRRIGPAADEGTDVGPLIDHRAVARITALVGAAVENGADEAHPPSAVPAHGSFLAPRIIRNVAADADLATEEIFGPVAPVIGWNDEAEMLRAANATEFGLAGYVFAGDTHHAVALGRALQCGMVGVNRGVVSDPAAPFGGMKQSGLGREGSHEGLAAFQETQFLSVAAG